MFCQQCGKSLPPAANFCPGCGVGVDANVFAASPLSTIYRPRSPRMLVGVCAAFARRYGWDLTATRILTVILGIFIFPVMEVAYLVGWMLIPEEAPLLPQQNSESQPR